MFNVLKEFTMMKILNFVFLTFKLSSVTTDKIMMKNPKNVFAHQICLMMQDSNVFIATNLPSGTKLVKHVTYVLMTVIRTSS